MADGVVITRLDPSTTGTALDLTLSYDDLSTLANFGKSEEVDLQYKKVTAEDGSAWLIAITRIMRTASARTAAMPL